jgi:PAS domain S-box-containing protein
MDPKPLTEFNSPEKFLNALAENYLLQDAILDASELVVISANPKGIIISINRAGEELLGYTSIELLGKEDLARFHDPHELEKHASELTGALGHPVDAGVETLLLRARGEVPTDRREWTYLRKNGDRFPVSLSISGIRDEKKELVGFLAIATDITEQRKIEAARMESERKFKLLAENIQGTIYLCRNDETFSMIYLNDQVLSLTGYSPEEFISGKINFVQLYHPDDKAGVFDSVENAIRRKESFHLQYRIRHRTAGWRWIEEVGIGIYQNEELLMLEGHLVDITERKKDENELTLSKKNLEVAAEELQEQNRQLNEFAHIISHNLRSPVANIGVLVSLVNDNSPLDEYKAIFNKLKTASGNLQETLNDLMGALAIKKDNQVERVRLSFREVFTRIKQDLAGEIIRCDAILSYDFSGCPEIEYPKTYLESIFLNLLSNALKYRSPVRTLRVEVKTFRQDGKEVLTVKDNGLGIDLVRHREKLFNLRQTFHEHSDARGVGLFLTRTQIEAMGGRISATSDVDRGSTFTVYFR